MTRVLRSSDRAVLALVLLLSAGCNKANSGGSSGSNWLTCETFADCAGAEQAVSCTKGYCVDDAGERIAGKHKSRAHDAGRAPEMDDAGQESEGGMSDGGASDAASAIDAGRADARDAGAPDSCDWGADPLLAKIGIALPGRTNCGLYSWNGMAASDSQTAMDIAGAMRCFDAAIAAAKAVEVTINHCSDCSLFSLYVASPNGQRFEITNTATSTASPGGGEFIVNECDAIVLDNASFDEALQDVTCVEPVERYRCDDPVNRNTPTTQLAVLPRLPVTPFKLADAASPSDKSVTLHLQVTNSTTAPSASIDVYIAGVHVVTGDFDSPSSLDPNPRYTFHVSVPVGTLFLRGWSGPRDNKSINGQVDALADRWVVLEYIESPMVGRAFTLEVSDQTLGFN